MTHHAEPRVLDVWIGLQLGLRGAQTAARCASPAMMEFLAEPGSSFARSVGRDAWIDRARSAVALFPQDTLDRECDFAVCRRWSRPGRVHLSLVMGHRALRPAWNVLARCVLSTTYGYARPLQ